MPNFNYQKGRRKEYKIIKEYRDLGYDIVFRSAGSHSPIDVVAISKDLKLIVFIQSKPDNFAQSKTNKIIAENKELINKEYLVNFRVE